MGLPMPNAKRSQTHSARRAGADAAASRTPEPAHCLLDQRGVVLEYDSRTRDWLDLGASLPADDLEWVEIWPKESRPLIRHAFQCAQAGEEVTFSIHRSREDGGTQWLRLTMSPESGEKGQVRRVRVDLIDATVERAAETQTYRTEM